MRVKQKLDGYEEGEMRSVHGQVIFSTNGKNTSDTSIFHYSLLHVCILYVMFLVHFSDSLCYNYHNTFMAYLV